MLGKRPRLEGTPFCFLWNFLEDGSMQQKCVILSGPKESSSQSYIISFHFLFPYVNHVQVENHCSFSSFFWK